MLNITGFDLLYLIAPSPLGFFERLYCMVRGPSRYVKYNGFRVVIFDTPYVFSTASAKSVLM
jgi:hypothetical protein